MHQTQMNNHSNHLHVTGSIDKHVGVVAALFDKVRLQIQSRRQLAKSILSDEEET